MEVYEFWVLGLTLVISLACLAFTDIGKGVRPSFVASLFAFVPTVCQLVCLTIGLDPKGLALFAISDPLPTIGVLLIIAVLPAVFGLLVDVPMAVILYWIHAGRLVKLSMHDVQMIVKYGSPSAYVPGIGRYFLKPWHMLYAVGCNILGALCGASLLMFAHSYGQDFIAYTVQRPVLFELVGPAFAASLYVAYGDLNAKQHFPIPVIRGIHPSDGPLSLDEIDADGEIPDVYLLSRAHAVCNALHIMVTVTFLFFFGSLSIGYITENWGHLTMGRFYPVLMAASSAFVWFSASSPFANRSQARAAPMHSTGQYAVAIGFVVLSLAFSPSRTTVWVFAIAVLAVVAGSLIKPRIGGGSAKWKSWATVLPLVITFAIVAFGLVCSIVD